MRLIQQVRTLIVAVLYSFILLFVSLTLLIFIHTYFYSFWLTTTGYTSEYFSSHELVASQNILAGALFEQPLSGVALSHRERLHIADVVDIATAVVFSTAIAIVLLLLVGDTKPRQFIFTSTLFRIAVSITYSIPFIAAGFFLLRSFDEAFLLFHTIAFTNDFWQLYPTDLLINVYPPIFFKHMLYALLTLSLFFYIISITFSFILERRYGISK